MSGSTNYILIESYAEQKSLRDAGWESFLSAVRRCIRLNPEFGAHAIAAAIGAKPGRVDRALKEIRRAAT